MTKKESIIEAIRISANKKYFGINIKNLSSGEVEHIVKSTNNFKQDIKYIDDAYNVDLVLKSCEDIKISAFCSGDSVEEVNKLLEKLGDAKVRRILSNKAQCKKCGDIVESKYTHNSKWCSCGTISVDGGHKYLKRAIRGDDFDAIIELSEVIEE